MKKVAEGVYFIQGQDEMIPDSHTYIIGKPSSRDFTMIDAGVMGKHEHKINEILDADIALTDIKRVIITHTHLDHLGCLPDLLAVFAEAEVWMHKDEADPLEKGDERAAYGMEMFRDMCKAMYGIEPGDYKMKTDRKLVDGETLEIGDMVWEVLHIPGHSPGSIGLYNREGRILIPGDVVYADYSIGRFDFFGASGPVLYESLQKLSGLDVDILLPGHNRIVKGLGRGYIKETARQWAPYLK